MSGRLPRRSRDPNHAKNSAQKQAELLGRLRRLEAMVGNLGSQVEHASAAGPGRHSLGISTTATTATDANLDETCGPDQEIALQDQSAVKDLDTGDDGDHGMAEGTLESLDGAGEVRAFSVASNGDLVVGDSFWTVFCKEVEQIFEAVQGPSSIHFKENSSSSTSDNQHHNGYYNFLLRHIPDAYQQEDFHPLPSQMLFLGQTYMDNIDPFMKVLHAPSMMKIIREVKGNYHSLRHSMQALMLAISFAAIISLTDEEVRLNFNTEKIQLVARYQLGTEHALEHADFLNTPDIVLLQAVTIYLGILQHTGETRSAWLLAGVFIRIAVSMKLHRDGSHFADITPFEAEMRRRLWWQMCIIDSQFADVQVSDYKVSEGMFDTEMPANVDDADLDPAMSISPVAAEGWTDTTVLLVHCEIWKLSRRLKTFPAAKHASTPHNDDRLEVFQQSWAMIEDKYLKHPNPNQPLLCFVTTSARMFLTKVDLILQTKQHSARKTEPHAADTSQSDKVFLSSLSIIEYTYTSLNEPGCSGWRWQIEGRQPPWHALRIVLGQLCTRHWDPICDRAWSSANTYMSSLCDAAQRDPRYQQLLSLAATVPMKRADELHHRVVTDSLSDLTSVMAPELSGHSAEAGISGTVPAQTFEEPCLGNADGNSNDLLRDIPSLEMDWQFWDEISGELELSPDFWDACGL